MIAKNLQYNEKINQLVPLTPVFHPRSSNFPKLKRGKCLQRKKDHEELVDFESPGNKAMLDDNLKF